MKPSFRLLFFALVLLVVRGARAEVIQSFTVEVHAQADTSLDVTETIDMDFEDAQRHGIYRIIPVSYDRPYGGFHNSYTIQLKVLSVTDDKDSAYHYTTTWQGRDINIKIGDADSTFTGRHVYKLHYTVRRAVNFFSGAPEVYWNATGNEWPYAMKLAAVRFYPPPGVSVSQIKTESFYGPPGATTPGQVKAEANSILFYTTNLNPGDGLTFVAGLPKGSMTPPPAIQLFLDMFADWWPLFVFPLLAAATMVIMWNKAGRDIEGGLPAQVEWSPPKDLTPAEVGTLIDESCDMVDIVSTLIDLAARGYLRIEEIQTTKVLFLQSRDYIFHRTQEPANSPTLMPHEAEFLRGLFGSNGAVGTSVTLSALKEKFYVHLAPMRDSIYKAMLDKRLFTTNPETTRTNYQLWGGGLLFLGFCGLFFTGGLVPVAYGLGIGVAGLIILLSSKAMPARTAEGSRKLRECLGFQRFVRLAEKDRIEKLITDDPTIFGRLLAYAIVLGVGDEWANKFSGLLTSPPDWYSGPYGNNFSPYYFAHNLGSSMNSMGKTFESKPPTSSGGSGGSGFSGGGSGGGFGGGGGGSW